MHWDPDNIVDNRVNVLDCLHVGRHAHVTAATAISCYDNIVGFKNSKIHVARKAKDRESLRTTAR